MRRFAAIAVVALSVLGASCTPAPPNGSNPYSPVSDSLAFGYPQIWQTWTGEENVYRASVTSLVLGPVDLCLVVEWYSEPRVQPPCRTINAVPGQQYTVDFALVDPAPSRGVILRLLTYTLGPAFVGRLTVVQGAALSPVPGGN